MASTGIALAQRELPGAEYVFGCVQKIALASDVGQAEAHTASRILGIVSPILR